MHEYSLARLEKKSMFARQLRAAGMGVGGPAVRAQVSAVSSLAHGALLVKQRHG